MWITKTGVCTCFHLILPSSTGNSNEHSYFIRLYCSEKSQKALLVNSVQAFIVSIKEGRNVSGFLFTKNELLLFHFYFHRGGWVGGRTLENAQPHTGPASLKGCASV